MSLITFAQRIRHARRAKGMSQQKVADLMGMTGSGIGTWERGSCRPWPYRIKQLAEILEVDAAWLEAGLELKDPEGEAFEEMRLAMRQRYAEANGVPLEWVEIRIEVEIPPHTVWGESSKKTGYKFETEDDLL